MTPSLFPFPAFLLALVCTLRAGETPPGRPAMVDFPAPKMLFLGNSITLHAPKPEIGWTGNWGMAASAAEKDYVHLLTAETARATGLAPQTIVRNLADFERRYESFDPTAALKAELSFDADWIIVALGENVPAPQTDQARAGFSAAFANLLSVLKGAGKSAILVRSCFWPDEVKDRIMQEAAARAGAGFVDIAEIGREASNAARSERTIAHAGVAGHPGDKGMQQIAGAIFAAMQKQAGWPATAGAPAKPPP